MNCRQLRKRLVAYQDGELGPEEKALVSEHLQSCPSCRSIYTEMEDVWQSLDMVPEIEPSPEFYEHLSQKIHVPAKQHHRLWPSWFLEFFPSPAATFAILLIGLSLGIFLGNYIAADGQLAFSSQTARNEAAPRLDYLRAFAPAPPGTIGNGYLQLANTMEGHAK